MYVSHYCAYSFNLTLKIHWKNLLNFIYKFTELNICLNIVLTKYLLAVNKDLFKMKYLLNKYMFIYLVHISLINIYSNKYLTKFNKFFFDV